MRGYERLAVAATLLLLGAAARLVAGAGASSPSWRMTVLAEPHGSGDCFVTAMNERGQVVGACAGPGRLRAVMWDKGRPIDLGSIDGLDSHALGINDRGQVIGVSQRWVPVPTTEKLARSIAWVWERGRLVNLGSLGRELTEVKAINDRGQIIGSSLTKNHPEPHGFVWEKGHMRDLGRVSLAAINGLGEIVGTSVLTGGNPGHAFVWQDGKMTDLRTPGEKTSGAAAINNRGQVLGSHVITNADWAGRAVLWEKGRMIELGRFVPVAINELGQVIGRRYDKQQKEHAVLWRNGRLTDLGLLGGRNRWARPVAINDRSEIIGESDATAPKGYMFTHAFVWEQGRIVDLGSLGSDSEAVAINSHGQIAGSSFPKSGHRRAVIWTRR